MIASWSESALPFIASQTDNVYVRAPDQTLCVVSQQTRCRWQECTLKVEMHARGCVNACRTHTYARAEDGEKTRFQTHEHAQEMESNWAAGYQLGPMNWRQLRAASLLTSTALGSSGNIAVVAVLTNIGLQYTTGWVAGQPT